MNKLPARVRREIEKALVRVRMNHPDNRCGVDDEHKEAMRIYLESWVAGPLQNVLEWDSGKRKANWIEEY